ncbi:uncharacterized protein LOC111994610 [Quercus suber]|uniref:uncharacterized protein LOC111994610 n=1 Tax=Quercus suber TaxID=58331 RepID=UPI0032DFE626
MDDFRNLLDECRLADLGFVRYPYTWNNKRPGLENTQERLDRAMANTRWKEKFHASSVTHPFSYAFDHRPLLLHAKFDLRHCGKCTRSFRFEEAWLIRANCEEVITEAWGSVGNLDSGLRCIKDKINRCGSVLQAWGANDTNPNVPEIKRVQKKVEELSMVEPIVANKFEFLAASKIPDDLLLKQEIYWAQQSRVAWLKHGDKNTNFFHSKASQRRRRNFINGVRDNNNIWVEEPEEVADVAIECFESIFYSGSCQRMEECLDAVKQKVTPTMQDVLSSEFSAEEIKAALFQMGPTKALGPEGMNALFYQKYWHVVGDDVVAAVLDFLNSGNMIPEINYTHIVLIPKIETDTSQLIAPTQSVFVLGRLITDNVLVAYETLHAMHCKKSGKKGSLALKLDVSKAYGRVEWEFLKDDLLLFCQATQEEMQCITDTLQLYADSSRQCINFEKSSMFFSKNTTRRQRGLIENMLGVKEVEKFETYLGLPTLLGRSKCQAFSFLKDRVWKKLQGWKGKMLSRAGKEVLIKAVAQSIPTHTMGVFLIPAKFCHELNALCARFWWGQTGDERQIHWKNWGALCLPKREGGMGFCDLKDFNLAMLAKQGWRLIQQKESLLYRCFKARYFPWFNFLNASNVPNSSYVWKSLMAAQPVLKEGCCWRVGDGFAIRVTSDKWIPNQVTNQVLYPPVEEEWEWRVSDLIDSSTNSWDRVEVMAKFQRSDAKAILQIPLSRRQVLDVIFWLHTKSGEYTVKSGYHTARLISKLEADKGECSGGVIGGLVWVKLWKLKIPNKIKVFGWRACLNTLPTRENLA